MAAKSSKSLRSLKLNLSVFLSALVFVRISNTTGITNHRCPLLLATSRNANQLTGVYISLTAYLNLDLKVHLLMSDYRRHGIKLNS